MYGVVQQRYSMNYHEEVQTAFGGYDHREAAPDGSLYDVCNMTTARYPALTVRPQRGEAAIVQKPNGFFARDCMAWVDGAKLVVDGQEVAELTDSRKHIAGIQKKLCIWPDKVIYDRETGELSQMEAVWEGEGAFGDGTLAGEPAQANTITVAGDLTGLFRAGDGVAVTCTDSTEQKTMGAYVIRETEYDSDIGKTELRFSDETWRELMPETAAATDDGDANSFPTPGFKTNIRIQRRAPELQGVFEHHNRLWGWHGGTVCCCKLGDPTNWESFGGDSTDSWELTTGSPGDITGGISYGGRPVLFKENRIIRVYGDYPGQYSTSESESLGVEAGSGQSLAIAGDTLFYKSPAGIMAYSGGYPYSVSEVFGQDRYRNAVAGSDGVKYYVAMEDYAGESWMFVYDTRYRLWHREDGDQMLGIGWHGDLYALQENGFLVALGEPRSHMDGEPLVASLVEFGDFTDGSTRKKEVSRIVLRLELDESTTLDIYVRYDSAGDWIHLRRLEGEQVKGQVEIPIALRRCDHYRLRFNGYGGGGGWTLHALTRERRTGGNRK